MNFELKVQAPKNAPIVWNFEELRDKLTTALADYQNRVYTEETLDEAKADSAKLNKLREAISAERINRKKEYMKPFETFENQAKELCELIDTANAGIKDQLKTFEDKRVSEKKAKIESIFAEIASAYDFGFMLSLEQIFDIKWLNKGSTEKKIAKEITDRCEKIISDLAVIDRLPKYAFEAKEAYKETLDLNYALEQGEKMAVIQQRKQQVQKEVAENEEPKYPLCFKCEITIAQAKALKAFCEANGIELKQIKE